MGGLTSHRGGLGTNNLSSYGDTKDFNMSAIPKKTDFSNFGTDKLGLGNTTANMFGLGG